MRKYIFLSVLLIGGILTLAGCATSNTNNKNLDGFGKLQKAEGFTSSTIPKIDLPKGSASDLIVGQKVLVMSNAGQDGILNASRIMVGEGDLGMIFGNGRNFASSSTSTAFMARQRTDSANTSVNPSRGSGNGGNWAGNRGNGGNAAFGGAKQGQRPMGRQGASNIRGEIIKKDATSLVIKTDDSGSKIVYYSDKTEIFLLPPPGKSAEKK